MGRQPEGAVNTRAWTVSSTNRGCRYCDSSTGRSSASRPLSSWVFTRDPYRARISLRCRLIRSPCRSYAAHASAGAFTRCATYSTAGAGTSLADSGNRASVSKIFRPRQMTRPWR